MENPSNIVPDQLIVLEGDAGLVPKASSGDVGKVLGVLNSSGDVGWVPDQEGMAQVQSDWDQTDSSQVSYIANKPDLSVYATTSAMSTALAGKQDTISDLADIRSGAAKGDTAVQPAALDDYATTSAMNTALAGKQDTISDLATIRAGASAGATAVQPSDLATVATSGSYADLSNKPTIPSVDQTYNAASANAQSGVAVAQAIAAIPSVSYTAGNGIDITANAVSVKAGRNLGFEANVTTVTLQSPRSQVVDGVGYSLLGKLDADTVALLKSGTISLTPKYSYTISMTGIITSGARFAICQASPYNMPYNSGKWLISDDVLSESGDTSFALTADTAYNVDFSTLSSKSTGTWADVEADPTNFYLAIAAYSTQYSIADVQSFGQTGAITNAPNPGDVSSYTVGDPSDLYLYAVDQIPASTSADSGKVLTVDAQGEPQWQTAQGGGSSPISMYSLAATQYQLPVSNTNIAQITHNGFTLSWTAQPDITYSQISLYISNSSISSAYIFCESNASSNIRAVTGGTGDPNGTKVYTPQDMSTPLNASYQAAYAGSAQYTKITVMYNDNSAVKSSTFTVLWSSSAVDLDSNTYALEAKVMVIDG